VRGNQIAGNISSDNEAVLGSSRKRGGAAEHLIDGSEKRICWSSFEFWSPRVIERRSDCIKPAGGGGETVNIINPQLLPVNTGTI